MALSQTAHSTAENPLIESLFWFHLHTTLPRCRVWPSFFFFFFIVTITGSRQKIESCEGIKPNPFSIAGRSTVLLCLAKKDKGAFKWWLRFLCSVSVVDWMLQYHGCDSFEVGCCLMSQAYAQIWMYSVWKTKGKGPKKEIHTNTAPWLCYSAS